MNKRNGMKPWQAAEIRKKKGIKGTNLQERRVLKGFSQKDLSVSSGIPIKRIQHYEQNSGTIDGAKLDTLCALSESLDCKIEDILESKRLIAMYKKIK